MCMCERKVVVFFTKIRMTFILGANKDFVVIGSDSGKISVVEVLWVSYIHNTYVSTYITQFSSTRRRTIGRLCTAKSLARVDVEE